MTSIEARQYYRQSEILHMRQMMRYGQQDLASDYQTAVACAEIMAVDGDKEHLQVIIASCFKRMTAYMLNNPNTRLWSDV